jgi:hypothetical protein
MRASLNSYLLCIQCLLLALLLAACADTTQMNVEPGASLADYHLIEIGKVTNDTGETYSFDVTGYFNDELHHALTTKGYTVAEPGESAGKALVVNCSIVSYSAGSAGKKFASGALGLVPGGYFMTPKDSATIKSTVTDLQSGKVVADLVSTPSETESVMPGTSFGNGYGISMISSEKLVLREAAWGLATQIDNKIKSQQ